MKRWKKDGLQHFTGKNGLDVKPYHVATGPAREERLPVLFAQF